MARYFIEVSYKGTDFSGFQVQKNANTIQAEIEKALQTYLRKYFQLTGSSRTDAGVHALQNYFHFDSDEKLFTSNESSSQSLKKILYALNSILPNSIVVKNIIEVNNNAHCRFDAVSREYKYFICKKKDPFHFDTSYFYPYPLDFVILEKTASIILNTTNFLAFSKKNPEVKNFDCIIHESGWTYEKNILVYKVIANRFLRGMVKGLVGTMLKAASNRVSIDDFLNITKYQNQAADFSVPSCGLFLIEVKYAEILVINNKS